MNNIEESDASETNDEDEIEEKYDTIFKMECSRCHYGFPLEELSNCQHEHCANDKHILYCLKCGDIQHQESNISHLFQSRQSNLSSSAPIDDTASECNKMDLQIDIALESRLRSNSAALNKLNINQIRCEICLEHYEVDDVYICQHKDCDNDGRILCQRCGNYCHERKTHKFNADEKNIKCVKDLVKFDQPEHRYEFYSATDAIQRHKWSIFEMPQVSFGVGAFIETAYHWRCWHQGRISLKEAVELSAVSFISNGVSTCTFVGLMALGAAIGSPGGPVGVIVGSMIGALISGVMTRYAVRKGMEYYYKREQEAKTKLEKEALLFFFGDENYNIDNERILGKQYRKLALKYHPDRNDGDQSEWLKLSSYYGVLTAMYEENVNQTNESDDNIECISAEHRVLIANALIKENLSLINTISLNHSLTATKTESDSSSGNTFSSFDTMENSHLGSLSQDLRLSSI